MTKRGHGEGTIYWHEGRERCAILVTLELRPELRRTAPRRRRRVTTIGDRLTVEDAVRDRLDHGLARTEESTRKKNRHPAETHIVPLLGTRRLRAQDKVTRNVLELATLRKAQEGRQSKSLTLAQASAILDAVAGTRMRAYVVSLLTGARTEELRALLWSDVDLLGRPDLTPRSAVHAVWRSAARSSRLRVGVDHSRGHSDRNRRDRLGAHG